MFRGVWGMLLHQSVLQYYSSVHPAMHVKQLLVFGNPPPEQPFSCLLSFHQQISSLFRGNMEGSVLQTLKVTGVAAPFQTSAGHPDHISPSHHDTDLSLNAFRELKNHLFILFNKSLLLQPRRREIS